MEINVGVKFKFILKESVYSDLLIHAAIKNLTVKMQVDLFKTVTTANFSACILTNKFGFNFFESTNFDHINYFHASIEFNKIKKKYNF